VIQSPQEKTNGSVIFPDQVLLAAFCLTDDPGVGVDWSQWLLDQYGGDLAIQGRFIHWTSQHTTFLNIPCPGTGHDGDPNISLEVTPEIKDAIRQLVG